LLTIPRKQDDHITDIADGRYYYYYYRPDFRIFSLRVYVKVKFKVITRSRPMKRLSTSKKYAVNIINTSLKTQSQCLFSLTKHQNYVLKKGILLGKKYFAPYCFTKYNGTGVS